MATLARRGTNNTSTRVEDYLSDKVQTSADLESVDELLAKVQEQQNLLKKQLAEARNALLQAQADANTHTQALQQRIQVFQQDQADIDRRLEDLTQSTVSDDAVEIFESRMQKVRRLEIATGYIELLKRVDFLVNDARAKIRTPRAAIENHNELRSLLTGLRQAQVVADQAAPHLIDQVEEQVRSIYSELRDNLQAELRKTLEKMSWPKKELKLTADIVQSWQEQTQSLLELQEAELKSRLVATTSFSEPIILLPLQVMIEPLILRFQYHFYGERPTNRLDKPEYFFAHVLDLLEQHSPLMTQLVQPVIDNRVQGQDQLEYIYTDAISSFINALIPTVSTKCLSILPQVSKQPQMYSHFVHELMVFDNALRDAWGYTPIAGSFLDWKGLTYDMLDKHGYFKTWIETEKSFALSRYKKIRDGADSNQIDYDTMEPGQTKPTKGTIRINDLLETVTDRYRSLYSFSQKLTFLIDIQISIFDDYHQYLLGAFQTYVASSHTVGRFIQGGAQSQDDAMGIKGLETLVKIFGSSEFLERKMSDWSEDIFFLELWDELRDRAKRSAVTRPGLIGRDLSLNDVAAKTSSTIKGSAQLERDGVGESDDEDKEGGALFDETAASFRTLRERAESEINRAIETLAHNALKPFLDASTWSSLSSTASNPRSLSSSSTLDTFLSSQNTFLAFLAKTLATAPLRRITRHLCRAIQKDVVDNVIGRHSFTAAGATQLRRDVMAIQEMIDSVAISNGIATTAASMGTGDARRTMRKLEDALKLLTLPVKASSRPAPSTAGNSGLVPATSQTSIDDEHDDGWGFDADDDDDTTIESTDNLASQNKNTNTNTNHATSSTSTTIDFPTPDANENENDDDDDDEETNEAPKWDLWRTERALFSSNESARHALDALSLDNLTESEARSIIRRRVEIGS